MVRRNLSEAAMPEVSWSPPPLLIDLRTAAQLLSVSVCEMRKLTRSKKIRYVKHGKKWLVSPDDLRQFVSRELSRSAV